MASFPLLEVGSTGEDVRTAQHLLTEHGHPVAADGVFGPATRAAALAFQTAGGLTADGSVGDQTWPALFVSVATGGNGEAVRAVQGQLRSQGWSLNVDGDFGPLTDRAVRDFQTAHTLPIDGVVGIDTWEVLVARFNRLASAEAAAAHLFDAWGANDRGSALVAATQAAVDTVLRVPRGLLAPFGCSPDPDFGPDRYICGYGQEGGGVSFLVIGNAVDGFYVESATFFAD